MTRGAKATARPSSEARAVARTQTLIEGENGSRGSEGES